MAAQITAGGEPSDTYDTSYLTRRIRHPQRHDRRGFFGDVGSRERESQHSFDESGTRHPSGGSGGGGDRGGDRSGRRRMSQDGL